MEHDLPPNIHMLTMEMGPRLPSEDVRVVRLRLAHLESYIGGSANQTPTTINVTALLAPSFPIESWQIRTLSGAREKSEGDANRMRWPVNGAQEARVGHHFRTSNKWFSGSLIVSLVPLDIVTVHLKIAQET